MFTPDISQPLRRYQPQQRLHQNHQDPIVPQVLVRSRQEGTRRHSDGKALSDNQRSGGDALEDMSDGYGILTAFQPAKSGGTRPGTQKIKGDHSRRDSRLALWSSTAIVSQYKTKLCDNRDHCRYQTRCMFAHKQEELRTMGMNVAEGITTLDAINERHGRQMQENRARKNLVRKQKRNLQQQQQVEGHTQGHHQHLGGFVRQPDDHQQHLGGYRQQL